jgi:hypothetical protein
MKILSLMVINKEAKAVVSTDLPLNAAETIWHTTMAPLQYVK